MYTKTSVEINTFGKMEILYKNQSIISYSTHQPQYLRILWFMVANHGKTISPETIIDKMMPERDVADIRNYVRVMMHRIRKLLGGSNRIHTDLQEYITLQNGSGGYRLDISDDVTCDFLLLDKIPFIDVSPEDNLSRLLGIYQGRFLPCLESEYWVYPLSQYYERNFSSLAYDLLQQAKTSMKPSAQLSCCERVLSVCPLDESISLFYLQILNALDRQSDAVGYYQYFKKRLYNELDAVPSMELQSYYRRLLSQSTGSTPDTLLPEGSMSHLLRDLMPYMDFSGSAAIVEIKGEQKEHHMDTLQKVLNQTLRKNDMYTRLDLNKYLIMLFGTNTAYCECISERIHYRFKEHVDSPNTVPHINFLELNRVREDA